MDGNYKEPSVVLYTKSVNMLNIISHNVNGKASNLITIKLKGSVMIDEKTYTVMHIACIIRKIICLSSSIPVHIPQF